MFAMIPTLVAIAVNSTQAQTTTKTQQTNPVLPNTPPNTVLQIKRQSGNCPKTFGLWTTTRQYEGGGEFTIIADTKPFAGLADMTSSGKKFVRIQVWKRGMSEGIAKLQEWAFRASRKKAIAERA